MQGIPLNLSLGVTEAALKNVHLALQGLVLLGGGASIQLQDEGCILFSQHVSLVLCLSLPPSSAPALLTVNACCLSCDRANALSYASQPVPVAVHVKSHMQHCPPAPSKRAHMSSSPRRPLARHPRQKRHTLTHTGRECKQGGVAKGYLAASAAEELAM